MRKNTFTKEKLVAKLESLAGAQKGKEIFDKHFASKFPKEEAPKQEPSKDK